MITQSIFLHAADLIVSCLPKSVYSQPPLTETPLFDAACLQELERLSPVDRQSYLMKMNSKLSQSPVAEGQLIDMLSSSKSTKSILVPSLVKAMMARRSSPIQAITPPPIPPKSAIHLQMPLLSSSAPSVSSGFLQSKSQLTADSDDDFVDTELVQQLRRIPSADDHHTKGPAVKKKIIKKHPQKICNSTLAVGNLQVPTTKPKVSLRRSHSLEANWSSISIGQKLFKNDDGVLFSCPRKDLEQWRKVAGLQDSICLTGSLPNLDSESLNYVDPNRFLSIAKCVSEGSTKLDAETSRRVKSKTNEIVNSCCICFKEKEYVPLIDQNDNWISKEPQKQGHEQVWTQSQAQIKSLPQTLPKPQRPPYSPKTKPKPQPVQYENHSSPKTVPNTLGFSQLKKCDHNVMLSTTPPVQGKQVTTEPTLRRRIGKAKAPPRPPRPHPHNIQKKPDLTTTAKEVLEEVSRSRWTN